MHRPNNALLASFVLSMLIGIVGGGVMGGLAGYYAAQSALPATVIGSPVSATGISPTAHAALPAVTSQTFNEDSAVIEAVRKVNPAVVTIINQMQPQRGYYRRSFAPTASGSGLIIDPKGYILTNNHVIQNAQSLQVIYSDGSSAEATLVGGDSGADIAVLQVKGSVPAVAQWGNSDALTPGQVAIAIGSPLGDYPGTVTVGVVSGLNRSVGPEQGLIQTDAAINNGNSGGPLINLMGEVIGINSLVVRDTNTGEIVEGLGFAIPSNFAREISTQLISKGTAAHP